MPGNGGRRPAPPSSPVALPLRSRVSTCPRCRLRRSAGSAEGAVLGRLLPTASAAGSSCRGDRAPDTWRPLRGLALCAVVRGRPSCGVACSCAGLGARGEEEPEGPATSPPTVGASGLNCCCKWRSMDRCMSVASMRSQDCSGEPSGAVESADCKKADTNFGSTCCWMTFFSCSCGRCGLQLTG